MAWWLSIIRFMWEDHHCPNGSNWALARQASAHEFPRCSACFDSIWLNSTKKNNNKIKHNKIQKKLISNISGWITITSHHDVAGMLIPSTKSVHESLRLQVHRDWDCLWSCLFFGVCLFAPSQRVLGALWNYTSSIYIYIITIITIVIIIYYNYNYSCWLHPYIYIYITIVYITIYIYVVVG